MITWLNTKIIFIFIKMRNSTLNSSLNIPNITGRLVEINSKKANVGHKHFISAISNFNDFSTQYYNNNILTPGYAYSTTSFEKSFPKQFEKNVLWKLANPYVDSQAFDYIKVMNLNKLCVIDFDSSSMNSITVEMPSKYTASPIAQRVYLSPAQLSCILKQVINKYPTALYIETASSQIDSNGYPHFRVLTTDIVNSTKTLNEYTYNFGSGTISCVPGSSALSTPYLSIVDINGNRYIINSLNSLFGSTSNTIPAGTDFSTWDVSNVIDFRNMFNTATGVNIVDFSTSLINGKPRFDNMFAGSVDIYTFKLPSMTITPLSASEVFNNSSISLIYCTSQTFTNLGSSVSSYTWNSNGYALPVLSSP